MTKRSVLVIGMLALAVLVLQIGPAMALEVKKETAGLAAKEFFKPELHISSSNIALDQAIEGIQNKSAWTRFSEVYGRPQVYLDPRSGIATSIITSVPLIPGRGEGNRLGLQEVSGALGHKVDAIDKRVVADIVRKFIVDNREAIGIDTTQLGAVRAEPVTDQLWNIRIPQVVNGVPVRFANLVAVLNNGNLTLMGTETWGNANLDTRPGINADEAMSIGFAFAGGRLGSDELWEKPILQILPVAPQEMQSGEAFSGPMGSGYRHRLVWAFGFQRKGEDGRWEVLVDAHTREVLSFEDQNHYDTKKMTGGVYPLTNTEICPSGDRCGTMFPDYPMPFADTGLAAPNDFSNSAGLYNYSSGTVTTHLAGKYVAIGDSCGAVNESAPGDLLLGGVNGQHDCTTAGGSAGDTASSRSAFYEINKLKEMARGWLPANAWLQAQLVTNVNITSTCNAFYSPSAGTVNFYRSGGGCRNTGEIAAVFDHEWGHGMDDNDTGGALSNSSEIYADITAVLRLQASCVGYGFWWTNDNGCGMTTDGTGFNGDESQVAATHCNLDCSGVRGADWDKHADHNPDTPTNFICVFCSSGSGPCGREVHCENAPGNQTAWDLATRDLEAAPFNMSRNDAFVLANKVFYQGSGLIGNWETCTCPSTSNGCGATNAYLQWLAADDDDGNLANGTPHMTAIFAAFDRHGIACSTPTPQNSGCAGGPTAAPTVTVATGSNSLNISWTAVSGAVSYRVLRSEGFGGCDFGKAVIANTASLSYTDPDVANGRTYSYVVQAVGSSSACSGTGSACVQGTPQPCAGSISLVTDLYNCTGTPPLDITVVDGDMVGAGTQTVSVSSNTEHGPETVTLIETPALSGVFKGTFNVIAGPAVPNDGAISVSNGDSIAVDYLDVDYCGTPNVTVTKFATVDCVGPVITNTHSENVSGNSADVKWDTNEGSTSRVTYGLLSPPSTVGAVHSDLVTSHTYHLSGLDECSIYYYAVDSTDAAGNSASDDNGGNYYLFQTSKNVNPTYTYGGAPVPIPDNNPTGASATINVADSKVIQDINVKTTITHSYDGDLVLSLVGPGGTVLLSNRRGTGGDNFTNTVFDDQATTPISGGAAPFTGSFIPDGPLSALNGTNAAGAWTLKVVDAAGADTGTIDQFEITFLFPAEPCPTVGTLTIDRSVYTCSQTIQIALEDHNANPGSETVTVVSTSEPGGETVTLTETAPLSGHYTGSIALTTPPPTVNGQLSVVNGDAITVTYLDVDDGYGNMNVPRVQNATVDCAAPVITNTHAANIIADSADILFDTDTPGNTLVYYGTSTPPATPVSNAAFVTSHSTHLTGLAPCTTYFYYVGSADPVGNAATDNNGGSYYSFASDCAGPVITNVQAVNLTGNSADITFTTDEPANTGVFYGTTAPPSTPASSAAFVTSHTLHLTGLTPCTHYLFYVTAADPVGNSTTENNGGTYFSFTLPANNTPTYTYSGPPVSIPDNNPTGASASITITDVQQIQDLNVKVSITHSFDGDLILSLIGPDNTTVVLSNRRGSTGDNFTDTVFDQQAATPIASGTAPFTGSFIPDESLAAYNTKFANGTWTLKVVDAAGADTGNITAFELAMTFPPQPCGQAVVHKRSHSVTDACSAGGPGNADTIVDPGETLTIPMELINTGTGAATGLTATLSSSDPNVSFPQGTVSYADLAIGQSAFGSQSFLVEVGGGVACGTLIPVQVTINSNEGSWSDSLTLQVGAPVFSSSDIPSTDVPKTITDNSTVTSTINVVAPGVVGDVNVEASITHSYDGDLTLTLIAPNSTRVTLVNRRGVGGDNFTGTIFDDSAATPIASGTPPYTGSFRPEQPLSALNGITAAGTWTLEIKDQASGDTGTLTAWKLTLTTPNGYACNACALAAPGEVISLNFTAKDAVAWTSAAGATGYHLYRGVDVDVPKVIDPSMDSCERAYTGGLSMGSLGEIPSAYRYVWYLVRASNGGGYGPAGMASVVHAPVVRTQDSSGVCP